MVYCSQPFIWLSNISILSVYVPDECYSRNASCALNQISTFSLTLYLIYNILMISTLSLTLYVIYNILMISTFSLTLYLIYNILMISTLSLTLYLIYNILMISTLSLTLYLIYNILMKSELASNVDHCFMKCLRYNFECCIRPNCHFTQCNYI